MKTVLLLHLLFHSKCNVVNQFHCKPLWPSGTVWLLFLYMSLHFGAFWIIILYFYFSMNVLFMFIILLCWGNAICVRNSFLSCVKLLCAFQNVEKMCDLLQKSIMKNNEEVWKILENVQPLATLMIPNILPEQRQTCNTRKSTFRGRSNTTELSIGGFVLDLHIIFLLFLYVSNYCYFKLCLFTLKPDIYDLLNKSIFFILRLNFGFLVLQLEWHVVSYLAIRWHSGTHIHHKLLMSGLAFWHHLLCLPVSFMISIVVLNL